MSLKPLALNEIFLTKTTKAVLIPRCSRIGLDWYRIQDAYCETTSLCCLEFSIQKSLLEYTHHYCFNNATVKRKYSTVCTYNSSRKSVTYRHYNETKDKNRKTYKL